jgi:hypothetical protein
MIIAGQYGIRESSERDLISFFAPLKEKGLSPASCTVDGNPVAIKVMKSLWSGITIQRCIVHIQRQGLSWCRRNPRDTFTRRLRKIFLRVTTVNTKEERDIFLLSVAVWEEQYGCSITAHPARGRAFSDVKRARSMLLKALPDMFYYLDDSSISRSTNGLENYFSRLKSHYRQHRGLSKNKLINYFKWYHYFKYC